MRRFAVGIVIAATVVACGPPAGRLFHTTLTTPGGSYPLPVTLGDQTDLVVSIEPGLGDGSAASALAVQSDPGDPAVLIVTWSGGACESEAVVMFWPDDDGYGLMVTSNGASGLGGGCPAIALFRSIRVTTSQPIAVAMIDIVGPGS